MIENIAEPVIESAIIADFPFLGLPVVRQILHFMLRFLGQYFYEYTAKATVALIIDMQINAEKSAANVALIKLQEALKLDNILAIQKASEEFDAAMIALVHYDGSVKI